MPLQDAEFPLRQEDAMLGTLKRGFVFPFGDVGFFILKTARPTESDSSCRDIRPDRGDVLVQMHRSQKWVITLSIRVTRGARSV